MRTDQNLKCRLGYTVDLARRALLRVAALHRDPDHGPALFERVEAMLDIAVVAARRPLLILAQEDYVVGVLSLAVHAELVWRVVREIESAGAVPAVPPRALTEAEPVAPPARKAGRPEPVQRALPLPPPEGLNRAGIVGGKSS